jgi:pilus assembly protein Flp/PilA
MSRALRLISQFLVADDGPTGVEYAVMVGLITVGLVASISAISATISGTFSSVSSTLGGS